MGAEARPPRRSPPISKSQLPLQFPSTVPTTGELVPTAPRPKDPLQKVRITPVDPILVTAGETRSATVKEDIEDRDSPYAGEPDSFPDDI